MVVFVSGHLDLTEAEFEEHYAPRLREAHGRGALFVVGDARGTDAMAQEYLHRLGAIYVVYHMLDTPRNAVGRPPLRGGFLSDTDRDAAMTAASDADVAWVRPGREKSGTARNLARRGAASHPRRVGVP